MSFLRHTGCADFSHSWLVYINLQYLRKETFSANLFSTLNVFCVVDFHHLTVTCSTIFQKRGTFGPYVYHENSRNSYDAFKFLENGGNFLDPCISYFYYVNKNQNCGTFFSTHRLRKKFESRLNWITKTSAKAFSQIGKKFKTLAEIFHCEENYFEVRKKTCEKNVSKLPWYLRISAKGVDDSCNGSSLEKFIKPDRKMSKNLCNSFWNVIPFEIFDWSFFSAVFVSISKSAKFWAKKYRFKWNVLVNFCVADKSTNLQISLHQFKLLIFIKIYDRSIFLTAFANNCS